MITTRRLGCLVIGIALASAGCKKKPVDLPELYATRAAGTTFLERGQLPEAEKQFQKLVDLAPDDPVGYSNLGLTYLRAGRYADAEKQLQRARKLDPSSAEVALVTAKLYALTNRWSEARQVLEGLRDSSATDPKVLYALAELEARDSSDNATSAAYEQRLRKVLTASPANLAVRLKLAKMFLRRGATDSVVRYLEEVQRLRPAPPADAQPALTRSLELLRAGKLQEAREPLDRFFHAMELSQPYQASLAQIRWLDGPDVGRSVLAFKPQSLIQMLGVAPGKPAAQMHFADATADMGLPEPVPTTAGSAAARAPAVIASADFGGDGNDELFVASSGASANSRLFNVRAGQAADVTQQWNAALVGGATAAAVGDYDNDGWLDLFVAGADGRAHLLKNNPGAANGRKFDDVATSAGLGDVSGTRKALFVDLDHDGDLDLLLLGSGPARVYRNGADGKLTEVAAEVGLSAITGGRDAGFADFDGDGRIDLVLATERGPMLMHNTGMRRFEDVTTKSGLSTSGALDAVAVADYDNDGNFDVLLVPQSGAPTLWRNTGDGTFARDSRSDAALKLVTATDASARFVDVDNDGWLDIVAAGMPRAGGRGVVLLHNDQGKFEDRSRVLPGTLRDGSAIVASDIDDDGDLDLYVADANGVRVLRNEDGNANLSLSVSLVGLRTGSGKNNNFGIGAKLELRAGEIYQTRVVTSPVTRFGLGRHLKADVLRVEWPNGVPQTIYFPGTDQDVLELEQLKGSCAFAYTWDGKQFRFVTDVMWRSALGMPLGLMTAGGGGNAFAPAGASQEYLRIPGEYLQPRNGRYVMQLTEELWETAYADEIKLLAVDHPDSVDVFVDEKFVPPGPVSLRLFNVTRPQLPLSAVDDHGDDVLATLTATDDIYVSNLTPTEYQGVVEPHDLVMDLGRDAGKQGTYLFLRGWIYPTDASINVALSQQSKLKLAFPSLEVRDANGRWRTAIPDIGFPSGKNKTVVVDLAGRFPTADHHVRIRTNMQIYWDQAFVAGDRARSPVKITTLSPISADLHFRGFSRVYRKGGRYGPYWFAYEDVAKESPWRPIDGAFTRFGSVLPLLGKSDDMYVIMAPGDEATLEFDASSVDSIPKGWKRDFLLYSDGWIKDSDLNTAHGTSVGPLPYHAMKSYPYAAGDAYPTDAAHQRFLTEYGTRLVRRKLSRP